MSRESEAEYLRGLDPLNPDPTKRYPSADPAAIRMLNRRTLVKLSPQKPRQWRGLEIITEGYRVEWDYEEGVVKATDNPDVSVGERVLVRAPSGGVAGTDVAKALGERLIIVNHDEILARVASSP